MFDHVDVVGRGLKAVASPTRSRFLGEVGAHEEIGVEGLDAGPVLFGEAFAADGIERAAAADHHNGVASPVA